MTMEFALSARVTVASLFRSFVCIAFIVLVSGCALLCLEWVLSFCFRVFMRSAAVYTCHDLNWGVLILHFLLPRPGRVSSFYFFLGC